MQENTEDLPETARLLVSLIGHPAAMALIGALGGRSVSFSKGQREDGQAQYEFIVEIAGQEAADTLAKHFSGTPAYIPRCTKALRAERNRRILEEYDAATRRISGRSAVAALAERHGLTERHINRIVNRAEY